MKAFYDLPEGKIAATLRSAQNNFHGVSIGSYPQHIKAPTKKNSNHSLLPSKLYKNTKIINTE